MAVQRGHLIPAHQLRHLGIRSVAVSLLLALVLVGCTTENGRVADNEGVAPSTLWFAQAEGAVVVQPLTSTPIDEEDLRSLRASEAFATASSSAGRQIAYDHSHNRLWHSSDHALITSIDLETGLAGPTLGPFSDVALWGCSIGGRARTFAVDEARNRLLVSSLGGGVLGYDLDSLELVSGIGPSQLGDAAFDFRRLAIDEGTDTLWFSTATGSVAAMDLGSERLTGAEISGTTSPLSIAVDADRNRLLVLDPETLRAVDLDTMSTTNETAPPDVVALTWVRS